LKVRVGVSVRVVLGFGSSLGFALHAHNKQHALLAHDAVPAHRPQHALFERSAL